MLYQYVQYGATTVCYHIITSVFVKNCVRLRCCTYASMHRSDILNSLPFSLFFSFSSRNPQVADIYGFLLDHWLLHGVHMVSMLNHVLLAFLPFLFNFSNFFSSSSKHKNVRLLLVLIIILEVSIQMMMMIIHMMMVWCQKT